MSFVQRLTGALNFTNGETVAVKQIQLTNIPKSDIGDIMVTSDSSFYQLGRRADLAVRPSVQSEIHLLKNLNVSGLSLSLLREKTD